MCKNIVFKCTNINYILDKSKLLIIGITLIEILQITFMIYINI